MSSPLLALVCLLVSTSPTMMKSDRFAYLEIFHVFFPAFCSKFWSRCVLQDEGFKNVSLGNVLSASYGGTKKNTFVSDADNDILKKYKVFNQMARCLFVIGFALGAQL